MKIFNDASSDNINIVQSTTSSSTMISSLAHFVRSYVESKFPRHFFKQIYIDTSETVTQQHKNDRYNKNANKIPYPSMTITPEITLDDPIAGTEKSMHLSSPNLYLRRDIRRTYDKLVIDPDERFSISYTSDYITTNFEFRIVTNSFIQNADMAFFMKSRFQKDFFQYINGQDILTEIPKSFIRVISDLHNWDLKNPEEMDELRLYLIGTSQKQDAIQKRVNQATGKECFFMNKKENLLVLMTDLDAPSTINRDSQVEGEYAVTFRMQISCYFPNAFILTIDKSKINALSPLTINSLESNEQQESGITSTTIMSGKILQKKEMIRFNDSAENEQMGTLIYDERYFHDINQPMPEMRLMRKMKPEFRRVYAYAQYLNIDLTSLAHVLLTSSDDSFGEDDYEVDYDNLTIKVRDGVTSDIAVAVYANRLLYESIKKAMASDKNFFNQNYMTAIYANIAGESKKIMVKSFESKDDWYKSDQDKSLRISTAYGVGYVSLKDDDGHDGYKICLGFDAKNKPIIRKFEIANESNKIL